jgi:hypothetical protein
MKTRIILVAFIALAGALLASRAKTPAGIPNRKSGNWKTRSTRLMLPTTLQPISPSMPMILLSGCQKGALTCLHIGSSGRGSSRAVGEWNRIACRTSTFKSVRAATRSSQVTSFTFAPATRKARCQKKTTRNRTFSSSVVVSGRSSSCTIRPHPKRTPSSRLHRYVEQIGGRT